MAIVTGIVTFGVAQAEPGVPGEGDVVRAAEWFADAAGSDEDVEAKVRLRLIEHLISGGGEAAHGAALRVAEGIPGYRRGIGLARVGGALAAAEKDPMEVLGEALAWGDGQPRRFHQDAIRGRVACAFVEAGQVARAKGLLGSIEDETEMARAAAAIEAAALRRGERVDLAVPEGGGKTARPEFLVRAESLALVARELQEREVAIRALGLAEQLAVLAKIDAFGVFVEVARSYAVLGERELADGAIDSAMVYFSGLGPQAEWKIGHYVALAELRREWEQADEVERLLGEAATFARGLRTFKRPGALAEVAGMALMCGQRETAEDLLGEAIRLAEVNPNRRVAAVAGAAVCGVYLSGAGQGGPSEAVLDGLGRLRERAGGDGN